MFDEATWKSAYASCSTVQPAFSATWGRSTIGVPFDTVSVFIIRASIDDGGVCPFDVLPLGETGELALGGWQLATCYVNRPDQTAASFVDTQWGRVYKTGDRARIRPDGTLECLGRIDQSQVKLNGQRLELGEVEQVLLRAPECHGAVAAVISNTLVAFSAVEQMANSKTRLWTQCRSWLPNFMVPTDIVVMERFPKLPSGKVDRKRLIDDYIISMTNATENEEPADSHERLLCEVAISILGEKVGPQTKFYSVRLDSLSAIEYASALRERGISVGPADILSVQTPRELRRRINDFGVPITALDSDYQPQSFDPVKAKVNLGPLLGDQINKIHRLERTTLLQQSMIAETLKSSELYINQVEFELSADVSLEVILTSLRTLAECNEILRTGFTFVGAQLHQVIWKELDDAQLIVNVDGSIAAAEIDDIELFLTRPLLIEIRRLDPEAKRFRLLLTLHHAIYDGWTIDLIIEDLSMLLSGETPAQRPQFCQVAGYLQDNPETSNVDSLEFWAETLRGAGVATMPSFRTKAIPEPQRVVTTTMIPFHPKVLRELMVKASVGPQVLFQACLAWLWATVQGTQDATIGVVSSGRCLPLAGIDKLMGPCMTTLPLRVNLSRHRTILELLQGIHSMNRKILRHDHIPLSKIYQAIGLSASSKLFDVIFVYQESPVSRRQQSKVVREMWHRDATEAKLVIEILPFDDHFVCQTTFQNDVLSPSLVEAFTCHLAHLVEYFNNHLDAPIDTIVQGFPSNNLSHFNDTITSMKTFPSLSELVEGTASSFSTAPALCFAASITSPVANLQSMSYHDLNSSANQIARYLQHCGLNSQGIVAIIMEKSPLLYSSILGILKAGCAYLPILPSTPAERVKVILDQAEPCLCVIDTSSSSLLFGRVSPKTVNIETAVISSYSNTNLDIRSSPSDMAYVIYTRYVLR